MSARKDDNCLQRIHIVHTAHRIYWFLYTLSEFELKGDVVDQPHSERRDLCFWAGDGLAGARSVSQVVHCVHWCCSRNAQKNQKNQFGKATLNYFKLLIKSRFSDCQFIMVQNILA